MAPRDLKRWYQTAARLWLSAALLSLLLPPRDRLGIWLPLHLALAGAVSVAISGAMQAFAVTLTNTPMPPRMLSAAQFVAVNLGVAAIAVGYPADLPGLVAAGGISFTVAIAILAAIAARAWARSLNRRHPVPMLAYALAVCCVAVGAVFGALMGSGAIHGLGWLDVRRAHMVLNVLGWASITVVGTLVTLLPTVLRVRMPPWRGRAVVVLLAVGVVTMAAGALARSDALLSAGAAAYAAAALGVGWLGVKVLRVRRRWPVPLVGAHFVAALLWFVGGAFALAVATARDGLLGFERFHDPFLIAFVAGWLLQTLLGAWSYLLPMARPGHPDERRRMLSVFEIASPLQWLCLNGGLLLMLVAHGPAGTIAIGLALAGGTLGLVKAWAFPLLGRLPVEAPRARSVWG